MTRLIPYPFLTIALFAMWLLLSGSVSPGTLLLGAVLAVAGSHLLTPLLDEQPARRFRLPPRSSLRFAWHVLVEIVRSNIAVARIIMAAPMRERRSGFVRIMLDMRSQRGLTALAVIVTATPGTIWVEYRSQDNSILLHVLDLIDENDWIRIIKEKYEAPLMEIFQ